MSRCSHEVQVSEVLRAKEGEHHLDLLHLTETERLFAVWNATQQNYPQDVCVPQLVARQAAVRPTAVALVAGDQAFNYSELNCRANQLAHYLRTLGIGPEVPVCVCAERSLELLVALLGILKAGGAYVPLDPAYPRARLDFITRLRDEKKFPSVDALKQQIARDVKRAQKFFRTLSSGESLNV